MGILYTPDVQAASSSCVHILLYVVCSVHNVNISTYVHTIVALLIFTELHICGKMVGF